MHIELPEKLYYSIGEVAEAFNVNTSLIRFWEKEFEVLQPKKNAKGNRKFTPKDIKNLVDSKKNTGNSEVVSIKISRIAKMKSIQLKNRLQKIKIVC